MNSDDGILVPGELFRHFKGGLYQIVTVATHSESGEKLVIYQALYGDYRCYARPIDMFTGYNEKGEKRFEIYNPTSDISNLQQESQDDKGYSGENAVLFMILDANTMKKKLALIKDNRDRLDAKMLGNLAAALDLVVESDDMEEQYNQIIQYLDTRSRYEIERLR